MDFSCFYVDNQYFSCFSLSHATTVLTFFLLAAGLIVYANRSQNEEIKLRIGKAIGQSIFWTVIVWTVLRLLLRSFNPLIDLPFDLCNINGILIPLVMTKRKPELFQILYFWIFAGTLQGVITPALTDEFPHYTFVKFWVVHAGLIVAIAYCVAVYKWRPTWAGLWKSFLYVQLYGVFAIVANVLIGSNYGFVCAKPNVPTVLDYFGPHPWYLIGLELVGLILFFVMYLPFAGNKLKVKNEK